MDEILVESYVVVVSLSYEKSLDLLASDRGKSLKGDMF